MLADYVGKPVDEAMAATLYRDYRTEWTSLQNGTFPERSALRLFYKLKNQVKTQTQFTEQTGGYIFDGAVPGASGQGDTAFQYCLKGSRVLFAKIGSSRLKDEIDMCARVHAGQSCPTVLKFVDSIQFTSDNATRIALIAPYFPLPLSTFLSEKTAAMTADIFYNIAVCGLASLKAFHNKNLCHGDIKLTNFMLSGVDDIITLIDFGSTTPFGEVIRATTPYMSLDYPATASAVYDLVCFGVCFLQLGGMFDKNLTVAEAIELCNDPERKHKAIFKIALVLLTSTVVDDAWDKICGMLSSEGAQTILDHRQIYPTYQEQE